MGCLEADDIALDTRGLRDTDNLAAVSWEGDRLVNGREAAFEMALPRQCGAVRRQCLTSLAPESGTLMGAVNLAALNVANALGA